MATAPQAKATENSYMFEKGPWPLASVRNTRVAVRNAKAFTARMVAQRPAASSTPLPVDEEKEPPLASPNARTVRGPRTFTR